MDGLTRRTFPSAALFFYLGDADVLKVLHPREQAFRHLDLLQVRSSQVLGSMPVDSRFALKLSLKRSSGPTAALRRRWPLESCC